MKHWIKFLGRKVREILVDGPWNIASQFRLCTLRRTRRSSNIPLVRVGRVTNHRSRTCALLSRKEPLLDLSRDNFRSQKLPTFRSVDGLNVRAMWITFRCAYRISHSMRTREHLHKHVHKQELKRIRAQKQRGRIGAVTTGLVWDE